MTIFIPDVRTISLPQDIFLVQQGSLNLTNQQTSYDTVFAPYGLAAGLQHQFWACKVDTPPMVRATTQRWRSFAARLKGRVVLFEIPAVGAALPLGVGAGFSEENAVYSIAGLTLTDGSILSGGTTGLIYQAAPRYAEAVIVDFGASQASATVLKDGDVFGLGGNLYMAVADVAADTNGRARVPIRPGLWKSAAANDVVNFRHPTFRAQLRDPNGVSVPISTLPDIGNTTLDAIEVPYVT